MQSNTVFDIVEDNKNGYYISNWEQFANVLSYYSNEGDWIHFDYNTLGNNPFDRLLCLLYDKEYETLYGGTLFSGVKFFDGERFIALSEDYQTGVSSLAMDNTYIYAGTGIDLLLINRKTKKIEKFLTQNEGLADNFVQYVAVDKNGNLWIGSDGKGVTLIEKNNHIQLFDTNSALFSNDILSIAIDKNNNPYIGTRNGGISYRNERGRWSHMRSLGLAGNTVNALYFGKNDSLWFATSSGLSMHNGESWYNYNLSNADSSALASNYVANIIADNRPNTHNLIFSGKGGIALYDLDKKTWDFMPFYYTNENNEKVYPNFKIAQDRTGTIWGTTFGNNLGFARIDMDNKIFTFFNDTTIRELPQKCNSFFNVVESPQGELWFCSVDGVLILSNGTFRMESFETKESIADPSNGERHEVTDNNVRDVLFHKGKAWISKLYGIVVYDLVTKEKNHELGPKEEPITITTKIAFDSSDNAFIGTLLDGLYLRLKDGSYYHIAEEFGLSPKLQIFNIYFHKGSLYLCTDEGVMIAEHPENIVAHFLANAAVIDKDPLFHLYPNPTQHYIIFPQGSMQYRIHDLAGNSIKEETITLQRKVDVSGLKKGCYIVHYLINGQWNAEKLSVY